MNRLITRLGFVAGLFIAPLALAQDPLPATSNNPWLLQTSALQQENAQLRADLLARDITLANCNATVDTVRLNNRVDATIKEYERLYGGEWQWKPCPAGETRDCNLPVRVPPKENNQ